jgi:NitT/TauT family transport system permease protein
VSTLVRRDEKTPQRSSRWDRAARRGASLGRSFLGALLPVALITGLIVVWEIWVKVGDVSAYLLPAPSEIWGEMTSSWRFLARHGWVTLQEALVGFSLGVVLGFALAIGIAYSRLLERTLYPVIVASQAVPKIALAPLFVVWLGFGMAPKVLITALLVFFPIVVTSAAGLTSVDPSLLELLRSVNATHWQIFKKVRLPHALPQVVSGLKIGITLAVVGAVVGEWVGANEGLGYQVIYAQSQLQTLLTFASIAILVAMGVVLFLVVDALGRLLMPWNRGAERNIVSGLG